MSLGVLPIPRVKSLQLLWVWLVLLLRGIYSLPRSRYRTLQIDSVQNRLVEQPHLKCLILKYFLFLGGETSSCKPTEARKAESPSSPSAHTHRHKNQHSAPKPMSKAPALIKPSTVTRLQTPLQSLQTAMKACIVKRSCTPKALRP